MTARSMLLALALAALAGAARADGPGGVGLGLVVGDPSGLTAKYFLSPVHAVDAGLGFGGGPDVYGDYLWHGWRAFPQPAEGRLAAYLGLGVAADSHDLALRTVGGAALYLPRHPVEIFAELVPAIRLTSGGGFDLEFGLGARYYFKDFN